MRRTAALWPFSASTHTPESSAIAGSPLASITARAFSIAFAAKVSPVGICPGAIAFAPQGTGGFGYDPVFFLPELRKSYAQLAPDEKAAVSHRGKVSPVSSTST